MVQLVRQTRSMKTGKPHRSSLGHNGLMVEMHPREARQFWKALMDNASALIADADLLLQAASFGRAKSLCVLAQEELGKALWIYDVFSSAWSAGSETPLAVEALSRDGLRHQKKYLEAIVYGNELAMFWGDYSSLRIIGGDEASWKAEFTRRQTAAAAAAKEANLAKQRGFYVDRDADGAIHSPSEAASPTIADELQSAAQVIEMLLISDHTRMQGARTPYDSTHAQQVRLLPTAHPEEWAAALRPGSADGNDGERQEREGAA